MPTTAVGAFPIHLTLVGTGSGPTVHATAVSPKGEVLKTKLSTRTVVSVPSAHPPAVQW